MVGNDAVRSWDYLGLECTEGDTKKEVGKPSIGLFNVRGINMDKMIGLAQGVVKDAEILASLPTLKDIAKVAAFQSPDAAAELTAEALKTEGLPDYNTFTFDAANSILGQLDGVIDRIGNEREGEGLSILFRGGMIHVKVRCCECECDRYGFLWLQSRNVWECDDWEEFDFVAGRNGVVYTLKDWNNGAGPLRNGLPKPMNKINNLDIAQAVKMAKDELECD